MFFSDRDTVCCFDNFDSIFPMYADLVPILTPSELCNENYGTYFIELRTFKV